MTSMRSPGHAGVAPVQALFIHRELPFHGGGPKAILYFAEHRNPSRVTTHVASFVPAPRPFLALLDAARAPYWCLGDRGYLRPALRLRRVLRKQRIDVVVCSTFKAYLCAKLASAGLRTRVVYWIPSIPLIMEGRLRRLLYRMLARLDTLVFISQAVKSEHWYAGHRGKSAVIYYGIEPPSADSRTIPCQREERKQFGIPADTLVLGYVAEFIGWKQHRVLLQAFGKLAQARQDLHLVLIGNGSLFQTVREEARKLPGGERIHLLGAREDARRLLGMLDIYVHVSNGEGFGLAVAEAMLARLPVVAAAAGALPEFVLEGKTGLLFRPGDADHLASRITELAADPTLRQRLGADAEQYCRDVFSASRFAEELTQLLEAEVNSPNTDLHVLAGEWHSGRSGGTPAGRRTPADDQ